MSKGARPLSKHHCWKGDDASYGCKHKRVRRLYGRPDKCAWCDKPNKESGRSIIQYANISGKFLLEREDWIWLCASCHKNYDYREETGRKISESKKGISPRVTQKVLDARIRIGIKKRRKVIAINTTGKSVSFTSITEASEITGVGKSSIVRACKEPHRIAGGMKWRYL